MHEKQVSERTSQINITKEVKRCNQENPRLTRETVKLNKSVAIVGRKGNIQNQFKQDKVDLKNTMEITNRVLHEELSDKDIVGFHRLGKFEIGKNKPIKMRSQSTGMMKEILKNTNKLHEEESSRVSSEYVP